MTPRGSNILNNQNQWDILNDVSGTVTIIPIGTDRNQYENSRQVVAELIL